MKINFLSNVKAIGSRLDSWLLQANLHHHQENGQTLVEYGLIATIVSIAAVVILMLVGGEITGFYTWARDSVAGATA